MKSLERNAGARLFLLFWKASRAVMRVDSQSINQLGFDSLSDFAVLEVLYHKGKLPVNTIGEKVLLTSGSITTAVQRLERKGLVKRLKSNEDARIVLVELTARGQKQIAAAFKDHSDRLDTLFAELSDREREQFAKTLIKLGRRAESLAE